MPRQKRNFYTMSDGKITLIGSFTTPARAAIKMRTEEAMFFEYNQNTVKPYRYKITSKPIETAQDWLSERNILNRKYAARLPLQTQDEQIAAYAASTIEKPEIADSLERFPSLHR